MCIIFSKKYIPVFPRMSHEFLCTRTSRAVGRSKNREGGHSAVLCRSCGCWLGVKYSFVWSSSGFHAIKHDTSWYADRRTWDILYFVTIGSKLIWSRISKKSSDLPLERHIVLNPHFVVTRQIWLTVFRISGITTK